MKKIIAIIVLALCAACVPPQGTPGYSLAGPSGNSTGYNRPAQPIEAPSGTNE